VIDQSAADLKQSQGRDASATVLFKSGLLLIGLGLLHAPVFVLSGSEWEGPISWRKPILFGISTGMTLWSLGWIARSLSRSKLKLAFSVMVSVTLVAEVLLITAQQWRGEASHFNQSSSLDANIDFAMFALILMAFAGICWFGVRCCGYMDMDKDYRLSARSGMLFLILSCIIGFVISAHGYSQVEQGLPPETVGQNGVAKFPHGFAIHSLQLLPLIVFLLRKVGIVMRDRLLVLWSVVISTSFLLVFSIAQTVNGQSRFDLESPISIALLSLGGVSAMLPFAFTMGRKLFLDQAQVDE